MTVAQETRRQRTQKKVNLENEKARHNAEALCMAKVRLDRINEWRREAMAFMTTPLWVCVRKEKHQYKKLHAAVIAAHSSWIDAYGLLEELQAARVYAKTVHDLIKWSGLGDSVLSKAPKHL